MSGQDSERARHRQRQARYEACLRKAAFQIGNGFLRRPSHRGSTRTS
jgi:hypothetical protein